MRIKKLFSVCLIACLLLTGLSFSNIVFAKGTGATTTKLSEKFVDVPTDALFSSAVDYMVKNNLFSGTSSTTFSPNDTITRGMLVTVLWRLKGMPVVNYLMKFTDVEDGTWYTEAIRWAVAERIAYGNGKGKFCPNDAVTRSELVMMLWRLEGMPVANYLIEFDDVEGSAWYTEAIRWAVAEKIVDSNGKGKFGPNDTMTRAQAAVILMNFCQHSVK